MWKKILLGVLGFALLVERLLTMGSFFSPQFVLTQFKVQTDPGTLFLARIIAWFLLFIDAAIVFAFTRIRRGDAVGWIVTKSLSVWWILLGITVFLKFGRPDNLFLHPLPAKPKMLSSGGGGCEPKNSETLLDAQDSARLLVTGFQGQHDAERRGEPDGDRRQRLADGHRVEPGVQ